MWNLELHIEVIETDFNRAGKDIKYMHIGSGETYRFWHIIETKEMITRSELDMWQTIFQWKLTHGLDRFKHHYFICLSRVSNGVNNYNEKVFLNQ